MKCERCLTETRISIVSMFNTQTICLPCEATEKKLPEYEAARKAESEACKRGDYNFPGVGLPSK